MTYRHCAPEGALVAYGRTAVCTHPQPKCDWEDCDDESLPNAYTCTHHLLADTEDDLSRNDDYLRLYAVSRLAANGYLTMRTDPVTQEPYVGIALDGESVVTIGGAPLESVWAVLHSAVRHLIERREQQGC